MARFTLVIMNRNTSSYSKGDVIEILNPGQSPGKKAAASARFSYMQVNADSKADLEYLKRPEIDVVKEADGGNIYLARRNHRYSDVVTNALSKAWNAPTSRARAIGLTSKDGN